MSLINEMLKDLDKRGGDPAGSTARSGIRAVPNIAKKRNPWRWIVGLLLVICGAAAWMLWDTPLLHFQQSAAPASVPTASRAPAAASTPVPANASPPVAAALGAQAVPAVPDAAALNELPKVMPQPAAAPKPAEERRIQNAVTAKSTRAGGAPLPPAPATEGAMKLALSGTLASISPPETKPTVPARGKRHANANVPAHMSKESTPQQQAENAYGRAVGQIEAGNMPEAMVTLEGVLAKTPRHAAARQALVGLQLDAKRSGDAMRVLKDGLQADASQTGMAMILARLQVEKGDTAAAIATLQQSLPHASHKADYRAFLAALYQRERRHKEAITHYQQALRHAPDNGVWWMGYGISLQAEGRNADARTAYSHARDTERLSPSLRAFVEQRISQLQ